MLLKFVGTDSYLMHSFFPSMSIGWRIKVIVKRLFIKLLDKFLVQEYIIDHENLERHLRRAGLKKECRVFRDPVRHPRPFDKIPHKTFNVLIYDPSKRKKNPESIRWVYGLDMIDRAKEILYRQFDNIRFITVDGSSDMSQVWPLIDFYLRPNRVDGASRMRQESEINNIPYYWTYEDTRSINIVDINGTPYYLTGEEEDYRIDDIVRRIKEEYSLRNI